MTSSLTPLVFQASELQIILYDSMKHEKKTIHTAMLFKCPLVYFGSQNNF